jgi:GPH family glycoside/pentoside/hexuronide:cation symporter
MFYFWYFLIGSIVFYVGYTIFATPWVALGYELTPDYHERTRLMGVQNFIGQLGLRGVAVVPVDHEPEGVVPEHDGGGGGAGDRDRRRHHCRAMGILPALFLRERFQHAAEPAEEPEAQAARDGGHSAQPGRVLPRLRHDARRVRSSSCVRRPSWSSTASS